MAAMPMKHSTPPAACPRSPNQPRVRNASPANSRIAAPIPSRHDSGMGGYEGSGGEGIATGPVCSAGSSGGSGTSGRVPGSMNRLLRRRSPALQALDEDAGRLRAHDARGGQLGLAELIANDAAADIHLLE